MRRLGVKNVVIIRGEGTSDEERIEVEGVIQPQKGFFDVATPIYEGDYVDIPDPRGGTERRLATEVKVYDGIRRMRHTEVVWGKAPAMRTPPVRRLSVENLHPAVISAAGDLFADGHYASAVSEGFKSLEVRVRTLSGLDKSGVSLMGAAFSSQDPVLDVSVEAGRSGQDEREGFLALFRGAVLGVRNPKAHELFKQEDPQQALEYLGFASLLHRRLDVAEEKKAPEADHASH